MIGYSKIAQIDLTSKAVRAVDVNEELALGYIGGRGWAAKMIFEDVSEAVNPFDPKNLLMVATGPLTAVGFRSGDRATFASISPETGLYGDSSVGGFFAYRLRRAGFDALVIKGVSEEPTYINVDDDRIEILDAQEFWGVGSEEVDRRLTKLYGEDASIASIGVAGERLVKYACVNIDWNRRRYRHGQAGRTGIGAIMGSKKLKAIVVKGTKEISVADPQRLKNLAKRADETVLKSHSYNIWRRQGTMSVVEWSNEVEALPVYNFQRSIFEYAERIGGEAAERSKVLSRPCSDCIVPCEHVVRRESRGEGESETGVEYETAALLGSNLGLDNIAELARANYMCDDLGIDTISAGSVIGFVTECFQKGLISPDQLGFRPRFGDASSIYRFLEMIGRREGFGDLMAEGVETVAEKVDGGSEKFAMHVKGLEISAYDHRAAPAMALSYATCDIGAHHNRSWAITYDLDVGRDGYSADKVERVIYLQHLRPLFDMLGACRFYWVELEVDPDLYAEAYSAVVGREYTLQDLLSRSEAVWNLTRVIGILRRNLGKKDDMLPERDFEDPVPEGKTKGTRLSRESFDEMLKIYYDRRGWDGEGRPTREKLVELGLNEAARRLYG